jgi:hypothetical protein
LLASVPSGVVMTPLEPHRLGRNLLVGKLVEVERQFTFTSKREILAEHIHR